MIIVIGSPLFVPGSDGGPSEAGGLAAGVATVAAAAGCTVQLVGRVGEDPAGEATLLAVARAGVGHVATLRDAARPTPALDPTDGEADGAGAEDLAVPVEALIVAESSDASPALDEDRRATGSSLGPVGSATLDHDDLELALRYLDSFSVVVIAEPLDPAAQAVVAEAAAYAGATLIALVGSADAGRAAPAAAIVLEAPASDPDGLFARTIGELAAAIDGGTDPATALGSVVAARGWQRSDD